MILLPSIANAQVALLSTNFSSSPTGMTLQGSASHADGEVELVPASTSQLGSVIFQSPAGNKLVQVFDVACEVYTGNAANASLPADGWCFAWGNASGSFGEEGPANFTGLVVSFDYYINAPEPGREVTVRWNGVQIASVLYNAYIANAITPVQIRLRNGGLLDVVHNGNQLFTGVALPNFTGLTDPKFAFGARTGGQTAKVAFDSLTISAVGLADQTILEDSEPLEIAMSTAPTSQPSAVSSNTSLLSNDDISITGSGTVRTLRLTPQANAYGSAVVTVSDSVTGYTSAFTLSVTPVNDAPTFTSGADQALTLGNSMNKTIPGWAMNISPGDENESTQTLHFDLSNDNAAFFTVPPQITPEGTLLYEVAGNSVGSATITVRLMDDAGGISEDETFTIAVNSGMWWDFETSPSSSYILLGSSSYSTNSGAIQLIPTTTGLTGSMIVPSFTEDRLITTFDVNFDVLTTVPTGFSPADGYSFCWGAIPSSAFGEEGPSNFNGLVVSFDYFEDQLKVKWKGATIQSVAYDSFSSAQIPVHIRLRNGGLLDVYHAKKRIVYGLKLPGFSGLSNPVWGLGARTGSLVSNVKIDNLQINPTPITVTSAANSGAGTLRQAVLDTAGSFAVGANQIQFSSALNDQSIQLSTTQINMGDQTVLVDASMLADGLTLDANYNSRLIDATYSNSRVTLSRITLTRGSPGTSLGGAIYCTGYLELDECTISHSIGHGGGAIFMTTANVYASGCSFFSNNGNIGGGAIWMQNGGSLIMSRCTCNQNTTTSGIGGALCVLEGTVILTHCTLSGNTANGMGGGVYVQSPGTLELANSIIAGNAAAPSATFATDLRYTSNTLTTRGGNIIGVGDTYATGPLPPGLPNANADYVGSENAPVNAKLSALGNYGGFTQTMIVLGDSPALNFASSSTSTADQRGYPIVGVPDAGAYEAGTASTYAIWSLENPAAEVASDDADRDGQSNLLEYAFRTNPLIPNSNTAFRIVASGSLEFPFRPEATDLRYKVQASIDLNEWTQIGEAIFTPLGTIATGAATINHSSQSVSIIDPSTQPTRFWRVLVTGL